MPRALTDEQIDILTGQYVTGIYQELEQAVINDIARRVKKTERFTETAEIMARNMREQGFNTGEIMAQVRQQLNSDPAYILEVAQNTKEYKQEVMALIKEAEAQALAEGDLLMAAAGDMAFNDDFQMWAAHDVQLKPDSTLTQLKEAFSRQTADRLRNLTQSTGMLNMNGVPLLEEYQHEVDLALVKMCSGGFSYGQAVKDCVHGMARNGLCVEYPSGRKYNLDTAARMAIRTASSQLAGRVSEMNLRKTGTALVYVSAHAGARPEHALWQGQVYVYDRTQAAKYPQYADFYASTDYGSVTGLKGVNCSHNFYPYWEGDPVPEFNEPEPVNIDGKEYSYYDATQQQRSMERGIKQTKRELEGLKAIKAPAQDIQQMTAKLSKQIKDYNRFSSAANLRAKPERYGSITASATMSIQEKMSTLNGTVWPKYGKPISEAAYKKMVEYGAKHGVEIEKSFSKYDGNVRSITEIIKNIEAIAKNYPLIKEKGVKLGVSFTMDDNDYAKTIGNRIIINGNAYRNIKLLEKDYAMSEAEKWFVKGTTYKDIANHEMGHVYANIMGISGLKVAKEYYKTINPNIITARVYDEVSLYAAKYKGCTELLSETFASVYSETSNNKICLEIKRISDNILITRGHTINVEA